MTATTTPPRRAGTLLAIVVPLLLAGCQSFALLESNDRAVGEEEVFAAGRDGDSTHLASLHHVLTHHGEYEAEVVAAALTSVTRIGAPSSVAVVAPLADHADEEIRWHAANALRVLGGVEADRILDRLATSDPSELVREAAAQ